MNNNKQEENCRQQRVKVCVNGMTENKQIRGPIRYIYETVSRLDTSRFEVYLLAGVWQKNIYGPLEKKVHVSYFNIRSNKIRRALFFSLTVPWILRTYKIDIYHIPDTNPTPIYTFGAKVVSTIHDLAEFIVPNRFGRSRSLYRQLISKSQANRSDAIITVSRASQKDFQTYLGLDSKHVNVVYNGVTTFQRAGGLDSDGYSPDQKYILYVGVLENAKNVDRLVEAFASLPKRTRDSIQLKLVGRKGNAYPMIAEIIEQFGLEEVVHVYGYQADTELEALYRGAFMFAYVSEHEGFGLPVIEAMQYGLPVLTSNKSSLPEVVGDAALTVDTDVKSITEGLSELITNNEQRLMLAKKALARAATFDWERTAQETQEIYLRLAKARVGSLE